MPNISVDPINPKYFHTMLPTGRIRELLDDGRTDEALLLFVQETDFASMCELEAFADSSNEPRCTIEVNNNLYWERGSRSLVERVARLLRDGKLLLHPTICMWRGRGFVPRDHSLFKLSQYMVCDADYNGRMLPVAAIEPTRGYIHPHQLIATLRISKEEHLV